MFSNNKSAQRVSMLSDKLRQQLFKAMIMFSNNKSAQRVSMLSDKLRQQLFKLST